MLVTDAHDIMMAKYLQTKIIVIVWLRCKQIHQLPLCYIYGAYGSFAALRILGHVVQSHSFCYCTTSS